MNYIFTPKLISISYIFSILKSMVTVIGNNSGIFLKKIDNLIYRFFDLFQKKWKFKIMKLKIC
jgi:hypothetical protein